MEPNTKAIIRLAWARVLGVEYERFGAGGRITVQSESVVSFLSLWEDRVLVGPRWLLDRGATLPDAALRDGSTLLSLTAGHGGRLAGEAQLGYRDDYVEHAGLASVVVTDDPQAVRDLEGRCPPDDVTEVKLSTMAQRMVTLDELDQTTAGAGYAEWGGLLASVGVLTPPPMRRSGHGTLAAALAVNDALDAGLVAQWRARADQPASRTVARRLGFVRVGSQTTVLLPA